MVTNIGSNETPSIRIKCIVLGAAGAGKTSILRRYFSNIFHRERSPTLGADFYSGRVKNPSFRHDAEEKKELDHTVAPYVSLQIWDTAGRERFVAGRKAKYTAALSDAFFSHVDAAMLVYDATSSTSFTQLLKWHADLMERMNQLEKKLPVLIVANKIDLFQSENSEPRRRRSVPQRDVLGLGGQFRGKDCPYEYRASAPEAHENIKSKERHRVVFSTYRDTGDTWTTDGWYLDSVLNTEDGSHPDRDMVLLWCMRNGLKHVEVSALDGTYVRAAFLHMVQSRSHPCLKGTGIDAAMECLVSLAMESMNERKYAKREAALFGSHSNKPLDLYQRYVTKEEECRCWHPFRRY